MCCLLYVWHICQGNSACKCKMCPGVLCPDWGGSEDGHVRAAALQVPPMADVGHGIPQTL